MALDAVSPGAPGVPGGESPSGAPADEPLNAIATTALPSSPDAILADWLPANEDPARALMTLATIDADGAPDARSLLLSEWTPEGFWFHTDARSRKAEQLATQPSVALVLAWPERRRQLVVRGRAEHASATEASVAYRARNPYLQQLAWLNTDGFARRPVEERIAVWAAFSADHPDGLDEPESWLGFLVRPTRLSFWSGSAATASRRIEYVRASPGSAWTVDVRAG